MRRRLYVIMLWAAGACAALTNAATVLIDGVAAHVNEHTITVGDVMVVVAPVRRELLRTYAGDELRERSQKAYEDALDTLIARRLILDMYANQERIQIPEWLADQRVNEIVHEMFNDDRTKLMNALAKDHMTYEEWRDSLYDHIVVSYMRRLFVEDKVTVSPSSVRDEYERRKDDFKKPEKVKLRMIVMGLGPSEETAAAKKDQAAKIHQRALAGADFAALAREVSEGSNASSGGDWGWIKPRMLRPELADVAGALKPPQISDVVELDGDLYIMKVEGRQNETLAPFESVQPQIERELRSAESERMYDAWIARLKDKAYVQVFEIEPFAQRADSSR